MDCTQASRLIEGLRAEHLLADRAYDTNAILEQAENQGMIAVIPPKKNRKVQRNYDKYLYKIRHLVENAFLHLKRWRGIATRYDKTRHPSSPPCKSDVSHIANLQLDFKIGVDHMINQINLYIRISEASLDDMEKFVLSDELFDYL